MLHVQELRTRARVHRRELGIRERRDQCDDGARRECQPHPLADDTRVQRADWMSLTGLGFSVFFIIVIVAMEVPLLILEECR